MKYRKQGGVPSTSFAYTLILGSFKYFLPHSSKERMIVFKLSPCGVRESFFLWMNGERNI
jgi:hypothetical protein